MDTIKSAGAKTVCLLAALGFMTFSSHAAQAQSRLVLGRVAIGADVAFVKEAGGWGLEIAGAGEPHIFQHQPAQLEIYASGKPQEITAGYSSVRLSQGSATATADIALVPQVTFHVEDRWWLKAGSLWVHRHVTVSGDAPGGFGSKIGFSTTPDINWSDIKFLAPSKLYNDPTFDGVIAPGSRLHDEAKSFSIREMTLTAPLFALNLPDGHSVAVLDPIPKGETTSEEMQTPTDTVMTDARFDFGALGAHQDADGVVFGYWAPGTVNDFLSLSRSGAMQPPGTSPGAAPAVLTAQGDLAPSSRPNVKPAWRRRYNPIQSGIMQDYDVAFRFGQNETFPETTRNAWRWAWDVLKPAVNYTNLDMVRRLSVDVLSSQVRTVDGRTGIPYLLDAHTGQFRNRSDAKRAAMGFCARNIEIADEFLKEADRDPGSARSQKLRQQGLSIIATFVRLL
ncbi:MAG TPA: hypothetical protein VNU69_02900, partial [Rhizomicrobium sp.]|nr:hypothetical protein [Rhizomicrobium sp.]